MSADGKIADYQRSAARFGSAADKAHLQRQIAQVDGVLFGAGTLRAYHTTLTITDPDLLAQRSQRNQSPQPIHLVCSASGNLDPHWRFFQQPVSRWLLTTAQGALPWHNTTEFDQVLTLLSTPTPSKPSTNWPAILTTCYELGLRTMAVLGGGQLVADLLQANVIDALALTLCPLLLGGDTAPTPIDGPGFLAPFAPRLRLRSIETLANEVFVHYQVEPI
jgi:5-amino-6-(5-phosphoribosylamino)uracil reductase